MVPPTGKCFSSRQTHWFRVADGKLAEHWATRDDLRTMLQLGVIQPPDAPPPERRACRGARRPSSSEPIHDATTARSASVAARGGA